MTRATVTKLGLAGIAALLALSNFDSAWGVLFAAAFLLLFAWILVDLRGSV